MKEKQTLKEFTINAKLNLIVSTTIKAYNYGDAVGVAEQLDYDDFVTIKNDLLDGSMKIIHISLDKEWEI